jgi:hypothetical protein
MITRLKQFFLAAILMCPFFAEAQLSGQLSEFDFVPQRVYANPALRPSARLNIGIPFMSQIYMEHKNNWFRPNQMLQQNGTQSVSIDAKSILDQIDKHATTGAGTIVELFHVGIRFDKHYFHVRAAERAQLGISIPKDVFALAAYGNVGNNGFQDNTANFAGLDVNGMHYRELVFGYNYEWNEKWSFGIAAKYLYGMERIYTSQSTLSLRTDPLTYDLQSSGAFMLNTSGIYGAFSNDGTAVQESSRYIAGLNNHGMGADFGVVYRPIKKLELQFSGNDIGFISWKEDIANYGTQNAEFLYQGIDMTDFIFTSGTEFDNALDEEIEQTLNELEEVYNFEKTSESFRAPINGFLRYGASFELYATAVASGKVWTNLYHGFSNSHLPTRFAMGYNQKLWKVLQAGVHYTKQLGNEAFFGAGLAVNGGPFQFYAMVENMRFNSQSRITVTDAETSRSRANFIYPNHAGDIRLQMGMNLVFGMKANDKPGRPMMR